MGTWHNPLRQPADSGVKGSLRIACTLLVVCTLFSYASNAQDAAHSIGSYASGCLKGSMMIKDGEGYQLMRPSRQRNYGHPRMIRFIQSYAKALKEASGGMLLVGDIGEKKGGPMESGHASHQIGLDVDFWFWFTPESFERTLTEHERENTSAVSLVKPDAQINQAVWSHRYPQMLRLAASYPEVDRIFVNASIKRELCTHYSGEKWMRKIRPWWGHDAHFHVRLHCPKDSPDCTNQPPLPAGDGCDSSLIWWFGKEARLPATKADASKKLHRFDTLPKACKEYLREE